MLRVGERSLLQCDTALKIRDGQGPNIGQELERQHLLDSDVTSGLVLSACLGDGLLDTNILVVKVLSIVNGVVGISGGPVRLQRGRVVLDGCLFRHDDNQMIRETRFEPLERLLEACLVVQSGNSAVGAQEIYVPKVKFAG